MDDEKESECATESGGVHRDNTESMADVEKGSDECLLLSVRQDLTMEDDYKTTLNEDMISPKDELLSSETQDTTMTDDDKTMFSEDMIKPKDEGLSPQNQDMTMTDDGHSAGIEEAVIQKESQLRNTQERAVQDDDQTTFSEDMIKPKDEVLSPQTQDTTVTDDDKTTLNEDMISPKDKLLSSETQDTTMTDDDQTTFREDMIKPKDEDDDQTTFSEDMIKPKDEGLSQQTQDTTMTDDNKTTFSEDVIKPKDDGLSTQTQDTTMTDDGHSAVIEEAVIQKEGQLRNTQERAVEDDDQTTFSEDMIKPKDEGLSPQTQDTTMTDDDQTTFSEDMIKPKDEGLSSPTQDTTMTDDDQTTFSEDVIKPKDEGLSTQNQDTTMTDDGHSAVIEEAVIQKEGQLRNTQERAVQDDDQTTLSDDMIKPKDDGLSTQTQDTTITDDNKTTFSEDVIKPKDDGLSTQNQDTTMTDDGHSAGIEEAVIQEESQLRNTQERTVQDDDQTTLSDDMIKPKDEVLSPQTQDTTMTDDDQTTLSEAMIKPKDDGLSTQTQDTTMTDDNNTTFSEDVIKPKDDGLSKQNQDTTMTDDGHSAGIEEAVIQEESQLRNTQERAVQDGDQTMFSEDMIKPKDDGPSQQTQDTTMTDDNKTTFSEDVIKPKDEVLSQQTQDTTMTETILCSSKTNEGPCNNELSKTDNYCSKCGGRVDKSMFGPSEIQCPCCKKNKLTKKDRFCRNCGLKVDHNLFRWKRKCMKCNKECDPLYEKCTECLSGMKKSKNEMDAISETLSAANTTKPLDGDKLRVSLLHPQGRETFKGSGDTDLWSSSIDDENQILEVESAEEADAGSDKKIPTSMSVIEEIEESFDSWINHRITYKQLVSSLKMTLKIDKQCAFGVQDQTDEKFVEEVRKSLEQLKTFTTANGCDSTNLGIDINGVNISGQVIQADCHCKRLVHCDVNAFKKALSQAPYKKHLTFSNSHETNTFLSSLELLGIAAFHLDDDNEIKNMYFPKVCKTSSTENYGTLSYLSFHIIPVFECEMCVKNMKISTTALTHLHEVLSLLENGFNVHAAITVREFFRTYGSHVYMKPITLGGYFMLQTDCHEPDEENILREIHGKMFDDILMSLISTTNYEEISIPDHQSTHTCQRKGGPNIKSTLPFWESLLVTHSYFSSSISYGSFSISDFKGIWDIIRELNLFQTNTELVSCFLHQVWKDSQQNNIYSARQNGSLPPSQIGRCLEYIKGSVSLQKTTYLLSIVCSEVMNSYATAQETWIGEIDKSRILSLFSELVVHDNCDSKEETCALLFDLMHHTEMYLLSNGRKTFLSVMKWIVQNSHDTKIFNTGNLDESFLTKTMSMIIKVELIESSKKRQFCRFLTMLDVLQKVGCDYDFRRCKFLTTPQWYQIKDFFLALKDSNENIKNDLKRQIAFLLSFLTEPNKIFTFTQAMEVIKHTPLGINPRVREILQNSMNVKQKIRVLTALSKETEINLRATIQWDFIEDMKENIFFSTWKVSKPNHQCSRNTFKIPAVLSEVLNPLELTDKYPGKISVQELQSHIDVLFTNPEKLSDIPFAFLREVLSVNFSFREHVIGDLLRKDDTSETDFFSDVTSQDNTSVSEIESSIHPSDVLLAIYLCADMQLQKVLSQKIASCQFALPFIHQTFEDSSMAAIVWPLRDIMIGNDKYSAYSSKLPIVSFIRLGNCRFCSKSKLINEFLRNENEVHATFFHRESSFGRRKRKISNGVVEISWFIPSKDFDICNLQANKEKEAVSSKENAAFPFYSKPFTILNLRGDGNAYQNQRKILSEVSDIMVVLFDFGRISDSDICDTLMQMNCAHTKVIIVTNIKEQIKARTIISTFKENTKMDNRKTKLLSIYDCKTESYMNASEIKFKLSKTIFSELNCTTDTKGLEKAIGEVTVPLYIDENDHFCSIGKKLASLVYKHLLEPGSKVHALPLQGEDLWQKLSKLEKDRNRVGDVGLYDNRELRLKEINGIKATQFSCISKSYISTFIKTLYENVDNPLITQFFLSWLQLFLDESSRKIQFKRQASFREAFLRFQNEKSEKNASLLDHAERELANFSFGLEHCFREIGQVYESFVNVQNLTQKQVEEKSTIVFHFLPAIVARLLLLRQPFELMDGDAANVPLKWIKAVFYELKKQIGDATVFTVSVLGIQSSGKSTLLNTMFGLQFAVSAGRCTRGIYAQLVPVKSTTLSLNCDYILIIDTEGLRAPELSDRKVHHDNELATLVIGMADYTIINIKGENLAEVENVLQIVVHALLRCKQANKELLLKQSCILVHQNVSAQDAEKQMQQGHHKTIQNLDNIAKEVAMSEHLSADYKSFSDVIEFDPSTGIIYVPELWHGTPPMAPINTKYSSKVNEITKHMLVAATKKKCLSLSDTFQHFRCLWEGILKEDFVFSFRNCLEVKAYSKLESEYQRLVWKLEETHLKWFDKNARSSLSRCETESDLDVSATFLVQQFAKLIDTKREEIKTEFVEYMENDSLKDQMVQWRENKLLQMLNVASSMKVFVREKVETLKNHYKIELSSKNILHQKEKEINEQAQQLANTLRGTNPSEKKLRMAFEKMWKQWLLEIEDLFPQHSNMKRIETLKNSMDHSLYQLFEQQLTMLLKELRKKPLDIQIDYGCLHGTFSLNAHDHLVSTRFFDKLMNIFIPSDIAKFEEAATSSINRALSKIDKELDRLLKEDKECTTLEFKGILQILSELFSSHKTSDLEYKFNHSLRIQLTLHVSRHVFSRFREMNLDFYERTSVKSKLQHYKPKVFDFFHDIVHAKTNENIAANLLCSELADRVFEKVMLDAAVKVKGHVRLSFSYLKYHLTKDILEEICEQSDFQVYIDYILHPKTFSLNWLREFVNETVFNRNGVQTFYVWTKHELGNVTFQILESLEMIRRNKDNMKNFQSWTAEFMKNIGQHVSLTNSSLSHVQDCNVTDVENFHNCVVERLKETKSRLHDKFLEINAKTVKWIDESPVQNIFNALWGCEELCPWCNEPCIHEAGHLVKHRCIQHRPSGIGGTKWRPSRKLATESCNFEVQSTQHRYCSSWCHCTEDVCQKSHPCREYIKYMPNWDIPPQVDMSASNYWSWVMCKFQNDLAKHYNAEPPDIPQSWNQLTQKDAFESLSIYEL